MEFPQHRADDEDFLWMWDTTVDKINAYLRSEEDDYRRIAILRRQYRSMAVPKQQRAGGEEDDAEGVIDLMLEDMDEFDDESPSPEAPNSPEELPCPKKPHSLEESVSSKGLVFPEVWASPSEVTSSKQQHAFTPVEPLSADETSTPEESSSSDTYSSSPSGVSSNNTTSRKREREDDSDDVIPMKRSKTLSDSGDSELVDQVSREVQPSSNDVSTEEQRESMTEQPGTSRDINDDWLFNIDSSLFDPYNDPSLPDPYDDPSLGEMLGFVDSL